MSQLISIVGNLPGIKGLLISVGKLPFVQKIGVQNIHSHKNMYLSDTYLSICENCLYILIWNGTPNSMSHYSNDFFFHLMVFLVSSRVFKNKCKLLHEKQWYTSYFQDNL